MKILIKYAKIDRDRIIGNIETITMKINLYEDQKLVESLNKDMEDRLKKIEEEIVHKKAGKFNGDKIDYETGQICTFAKKFDHWRKQKVNESHAKGISQTPSGINNEVCESSGTDGEELSWIKVHTSLQEEFDFLRRDRKTNHRPWRGKDIERNPQITYRRGKSMRDALVRSDIRKYDKKIWLTQNE
ncbi:hypothetical protein NDU88_002835 [Pleurodeles waltl]|uniref:L1 transposable element RRM domain-containing protein n=1 Tax=Pleurodeles waltl TaxID=8319 RepID=A0AAV7PB58_PLEWA|nr:hypothetical protein NDU88_002835 [Pleurodeles waltl]